MALYYRVVDDLGEPERWSLGEWRDETGVPLDESRFWQGGVVESPSGVCLAQTQDGEKTPFTFADVGVPIVAEWVAVRLAGLCPNDVQLLPARIAGERSRYFVLNVVSVVDCLDEERSVFSRWTVADGRPDRVGDVRMMVKLVLRSGCANGLGLFRLKGWPIVLVASREVRELFDGLGTRALQFQPIDVSRSS